jgi:hypothetical protein
VSIDVKHLGLCRYMGAGEFHGSVHNCFLFSERPCSGTQAEFFVSTYCLTGNGHGWTGDRAEFKAAFVRAGGVK